MIQAYSELLPFVMPEVKGCSQNTALQALREASREFFSYTEVWQKDLEPLAVVSGDDQYPLDPDENPTAPDVEPEVRRIVYAKIRGVVQDSATYELTPNTLVGATTDYSLTFLPQYVPTVDGAATSEDGLVVRVVLVPDWHSDYLPDFYRTRWGKAIVSGALANLLRMPNAPWARPDRGQLKLEDWQSWLATAVKERYTGRVGGSLRMYSPVPFDI